MTKQKTSPRKRPKAGDLLRVLFEEHQEREAYICYLGRHWFYGDAIRVVGFRESVTDACEAVGNSAGYVTFYPVLAAARQGLVAIAAQCPDWEGIPTTMRRAFGHAPEGAVVSWMIMEGELWSKTPGKERGRLTTTLTPDERKFSIAAVWNHDMLCHRIAQGWRLEDAS